MLNAMILIHITMIKQILESYMTLKMLSNMDKDNKKYKILQNNNIIILKNNNKIKENNNNHNKNIKNE